MKTRFPIFGLLALLLTLVACRDDAGGYAYHTRYLPVQLEGSSKWSLLDVDNGTLVARDTFDVAPGAVVDDMFYLQRPDGCFDFYNIADPFTPVNSEPYGSVTAFSPDGRALVSHRGGELMVIDRHCNVIARLGKDIAQASMMTRGRAAVQDDRGNWGFIDADGRVAVPLNYASVNEFLHDDVAVVVSHDNAGDSTAVWTVIDRNGKRQCTISPLQYRLLNPFFNEGVLPAAKGDSIVFLDRNGNEVPRPANDHAAVDTAGYDNATRTPAGLFLVLKNRKMGLVDKNNKVLIAMDHDRLFDLSPDRYIAMDDTVCHLVDRHGKPVGDVRFVHAHGSIDNVYAARGFVDINLVVGSMMSLFGVDGACGALPSSTLMDLNNLAGDEPASLVGSNSLVVPQGPCTITYLFDNDLASVQNDSTATFNYGARVMAVDMAVNVRHCAINTEQTIINGLQAMMGRKGFVLDRDGLFASDRGTALATGYADGMVHIYYYMNRAYAQPLPRANRK